MMSIPNMIIVMPIATMVALLMLASNANLARIQQPPPWAALIEQAIKGFISGIFIRVLQCFDDLVNPSGLNEDVVSQCITLIAIALGKDGQRYHRYRNRDVWEDAHFTRSEHLKSIALSISIQRLPSALMMMARACLR